MGIFGKKRQDEFESLHNENLFNDDDDILIPAGQRRSGLNRIGNGSVSAPHALTADELTGRAPESIPMEHTKPTSVYERMKEREQKAAETGIGDDYVPSWVTSATVAEPETDHEILSQSRTTAPRTPVVEPASAPKAPAHSAANDAFLERCRIAVREAEGVDIRSDSAEPIRMSSVHEPSPYYDSVPSEPKTQTRSVDEIIQMLRGNAEAQHAPEKPAETHVEPESPTVDRKAEVEVIPTDSDSDIMHTTMPRGADSDVRIYGKVVRGTVLQHTPEGDVEISELIKAAKPDDDTAAVEDKTIMFGNLDDIISKRADDDIKAVNAAFDDDDYDDYEDDDDNYSDDRPYYETDDPELRGTDDYKDLNDAARLRTKLSAEKSKHKILTVFTSVAAVVMLILATPLAKALSDNALGMINLILLAASIIVNFDIFLDFKNLFKMRPKFDSCVSLVSVMTLIQSAVSTFVYDGKYDGFAAGTVCLLAVNRMAHLMKTSRILTGLELIANSEPKRAVVSVGEANAKTISSGAVDGEALVLCDRSAVNVRDYLKNCGYDSPFDRKIKALLLTSVGIAVVVGLVAGYFGGLGLGLTASVALLCCMFSACAAFVCELPMYLASKKASRYGAMLAGFKGAYELNLANLAAVNSSDLFPEGSVKLYNMKTLGENEIGKTLIDAGAVAAAADSPLSSIFKEIIGSTAEKDYPKVNGVQYEDKMGISGWIGERTILIGNRNLMQGHNISVPPASVDQKILRAGYFPVYIAVDGVPCLLFIVKYEVDPDIAHELQALCSTGMTIVVNPKDPNASSPMICDYFGLPNDALKVMNHNGRVSYERTAAPTESASAPAAFGKNICGFFSMISSCIRLSGTYSILTALFIIAAALGTALLIYLCVTAKLSLLSSLTVAGFQLLFTAVSAVIAKVRESK